VKEDEMNRECSTNGEKRIVYMILVGKPEGKISLNVGAFVATVHVLIDRGSNSSMDRILFFIAPIPIPGITQPPIQCVLGLILWGKMGLGVKLATHIHLVQRSRVVELFLHSSVYLRTVMLS
jgi:hypothetical protein